MKNMKKFVFLVVVSVLCGIPSWVMGQLKVDTTGVVVLGSRYGKYNPRIMNPGNSPLLVMDTTGISIMSSSILTPFRIFSYNRSTYLANSNKKIETYAQTLPGGIRIGNSRVQVYPSGMKESDLNSVSTNAPLQAISSGVSLYVKGGLGSYSSPALLSKTTGAITIDVQSTVTPEVSLASCELDAANNRKTTFFVKGDGTVYTQNGVIQSSDISKKENVDSISPRTALTALTALRGVTFSYKGSGGSLTDQPVVTPMRARNAVASDEDSLTEEEETEEVIDESDRISDEVLAQMEAERSRKRIGLIAQEVEQVVPEVVRTLPDGSKGIMYSDLIGMIIEGMKEIQTTVQEQKAQLTARIDSLRTTLDFYKSLIPAVGSSPAPVVRSTPRSEVQPKEGIASSLLNQVVLYQNIPNPFTATTEIIYTLPEGLEDCVIGLYDLNGQLLKQYTLTTLSGKVVIQGSELDKGTYIYTLSCGGQVLASRKIVKA